MERRNEDKGEKRRTGLEKGRNTMRRERRTKKRGEVEDEKEGKWRTKRYGEGVEEDVDGMGKEDVKTYELRKKVGTETAEEEV